MKLKELVYTYKTKYTEGFIKSEIEDVLKHFPKINMDKFNDALSGITCVIRNEEMVIYHCDILTALTCGIENRNMKNYEFD